MSRTTDDFVKQVRGGDYERFLAIQRAPANKRAALYAIAAFNIELATIAEIVSEPLIGHIRLAWWREALEEIEAGKAPRKHPLVEALAELYATYPHVFSFLHELLDARAADLDESLIADESTWLDYCNHTAGALHMAFAYVLDEACARAAESTIRDEARAYAMIGLARAIPYMHAQGFTRFPAARLEKHQLTSLAPSASLNHLVRDTVEDAARIAPTSRHNRKLRSLSALVALSMLGKWRLERVSYDPYALTPGKLRAVWCVMREN